MTTAKVARQTMSFQDKSTSHRRHSDVNKSCQKNVLHARGAARVRILHAGFKCLALHALRRRHRPLVTSLGVGPAGRGGGRHPTSQPDQGFFQTVVAGRRDVALCQEIRPTSPAPAAIQGRKIPAGLIPHSTCYGYPCAKSAFALGVEHAQTHPEDAEALGWIQRLITILGRGCLH